MYRPYHTDLGDTTNLESNYNKILIYNVQWYVNNQNVDTSFWLIISNDRALKSFQNYVHETKVHILEKKKGAIVAIQLQKKKSSINVAMTR